MVSDTAKEVLVEAASVAVTVKSVVPALPDGVPERTPALLKLNPVGADPVVIVQVQHTDTVSVAVKVKEYAVEINPPGRMQGLAQLLGLVMRGALPTVIEVWPVTPLMVQDKIAVPPPTPVTVPL
jgi:hypothetical protein